jgi:hypothetical protein
MLAPSSTAAAPTIVQTTDTNAANQQWSVPAA